MSTKTRTELINEAASKLQVVGSGQSLEDEDFDTIDGKVDPLLAQLAADEIVSVDDDDLIPAEIFDALASLLANVCTGNFGKPYSADVKAVFEAQIWRTQAGRPTYEPMRTDYF